MVRVDRSPEDIPDGLSILVRIEGDPSLVNCVLPLELTLGQEASTEREAVFHTKLTSPSEAARLSGCAGQVLRYTATSVSSSFEQSGLVQTSADGRGTITIIVSVVKVGVRFVRTHGDAGQALWRSCDGIELFPHQYSPQLFGFEIGALERGGAFISSDLGVAYYDPPAVANHPQEADRVEWLAGADVRFVSTVSDLNSLPVAAEFLLPASPRPFRVATILEGTRSGYLQGLPAHRCIRVTAGSPPVKSWYLRLNANEVYELFVGSIAGCPVKFAVTDGQSQPVPGVLLFIRPVSDVSEACIHDDALRSLGQESVRRVATDEGGIASIEGLSEGRWSVGSRHGEGSAFVAPTEFEADAKGVHLHLVTQAGPGLVGRIVGPSQEGLPNFEVLLRAHDSTTSVHAISAAAGRFSFPGLAPGEYQLMARSAGSRSYAVWETVIAPDPDLLIIVEARAALRGRVIGAESLPEGETFLTLYTRETSGRYLQVSPHVEVDPAYELVLDVPPRKDICLTFSSTRGLRSAVSVVTAPPGSESTFEINLASPSFVKLTGHPRRPASYQLVHEQLGLVATGQLMPKATSELRVPRGAYMFHSSSWGSEGAWTQFPFIATDAVVIKVGE